MIEQPEDESPPVEEGAPAWMATFGDMMSLLLTFFVLLLSFANMDVVKFENMIGSLQNAFGSQQTHPGQIQAFTTDPIEFSNRESTSELDLMDLPPEFRDREKRMMEEMQQFIEEQQLETQVEAEQMKRGVTVRVKGRFLFASGSAELRAEALPLLLGIGQLARRAGQSLSVEGHTDDVPIATTRFPSNWHLSAARAISAVQFLGREGAVEPHRLIAVGYGETRPLVPNDSSEHRSTNRRVEFIIQREDADAPYPRDLSAGPSEEGSGT